MFCLAFYLSFDVEDDAVKMIQQVQIGFDAYANTFITEPMLDIDTVGSIVQPLGKWLQVVLRVGILNMGQ